MDINTIPLIHQVGDEPRDWLVTVMGMPMTVLHNEQSARNITNGTSMKAYNGSYDAGTRTFVSKNGIKWLI